MRHAAALLPPARLGDRALAAAPLDRLVDPYELALIRLLASWPRIVEGAADAHEPHRIAFFCRSGGAIPPPVDQGHGRRDAAVPYRGGSGF